MTNQETKQKKINLVIITLLTLNLVSVVSVVCYFKAEISNNDAKIKNLEASNKALSLEFRRANALSYKRLNRIERELNIPSPTAEELEAINTPAVD